MCTLCRNYTDVARGRLRGLTSVGFFFSVVHWFLWETGVEAVTATTDTVPVRFYDIRRRVQARVFSYDTSARADRRENERLNTHTLAPSSVTRRKIVKRYRITALFTEKNKSPRATVPVRLTVYHRHTVIIYCVLRSPATVVCVRFYYTHRGCLVNTFAAHQSVSAATVNR